MLLSIISPKALVNEVIECRLETQSHVFYLTWCVTKDIMNHGLDCMRLMAWFELSMM